MANTIKLKRASSSDPGASDLATGELAIRTSNCKLFSKNDSGSAIGVVAGSADTLTTARTIAGVSFDGSANISLNNNAITNGAGYLADIVSDTSPQLGGDLQSAGNDVDFADNDSAIFGNGSDMELVSDGSTSFIRADDLRIRSKNNLENYINCTKDGAVTVFHDNSKKFETTSAGATVTGSLTATGFATDGGGVTLNGANYNAAWVRSANTMRFNDNAIAGFGNADDLQIYHDGSNSYLKDSGTGSLRIQTNQLDIINAANNEQLAKFVQDGAAELYHNGSKKLETASFGTNFLDDFGANDSIKLLLGNSSDLQIFHDGSNSYIRETGTGSIFIEGDSNIYIGKASGGAENGIVVKQDGAVDLYHNNVKKFETSSSGGTITGTLVATAFTGALTGNVTGNASGSSGSCTGNAATATALANARTIAGVSFDGSANISLNNNAITNGAGYITSANGGNAATLDSIDSSQFARSDTADTLSGLMTLSAGLSFGNNARCPAALSSLSDGSTITVDFSSGIHHSVTLGGNRTLGNPTATGDAVGQSGSIFIIQDGTGGRTLSFHSDYKFIGGTAPTLSTGANAVDRLDYVVRASDNVHCVLSLDVK